MLPQCFPPRLCSSFSWLAREVRLLRGQTQREQTLLLPDGPTILDDYLQLGPLAPSARPQQ
jgi:hypothetical protein